MPIGVLSSYLQKINRKKLLKVFINSPVSLWINVPFPILSQFGNLNEMGINRAVGTSRSRCREYRRHQCRRYGV